MPKIAQASAIPGKTMTIAQSIGCARERSRQSTGSTAPATTAYAAASRSNGRPLNNAASVAWLTERAKCYADGSRRARLAKMGLPAYFPGATRGVASSGTGRCEPWHAFLASHGEQSRESPLRRPPDAAGSLVFRDGRRLLWRRGQESASRLAARLLRRSRARRRDGREGTRPLRAAGLRAQADRAQPACR